MTDHDRGAYTPQTDAPLSFDARRASSGRQAPLTLLISGMVLVVLLVGVVYFYRSGVRRENEAPQVIGAPVAATKSAPPSGEQPNDAAAGLQVYKSESAPLSKPQGTTPAPKFTPAPEQPAPRPIPQAAPPPAQTASPATTTAPPPKLIAATPKTTTTPKPAATPKAATPKPAATPAATTPAATPSASGAALVQIGAFSSAALADKGWGDVAKALPGAMTGKTKTVQVIDKDGVTFYRTSVGGFASRADAVSFCGSLKAAGKSCIVK